MLHSLIDSCQRVVNPFRCFADSLQSALGLCRRVLFESLRTTAGLVLLLMETEEYGKITHFNGVAGYICYSSLCCKIIYLLN